MVDSVITFESLYDLARKEKASDEIQKLDPQIFSQIVRYLNTKIEVHKDAKDKEQADKIMEQISSTRRLIKELYERRERKIIQLAINKSRLQAGDDSALLKEEQVILAEVTNVLNKYRNEILLNLVNAKLPYPESAEEKQVFESPKQEESADNTSEEPQEVEEPKELRIKFISAVPKFRGPSMEIFGPYFEGDVVILPKEIADVLITRERAILEEEN